VEMQRRQVEDANKLKSQFLSNMSHELRTPLNSILALSRVLIMQSGDKLTEEENEYLEIVERNGKQLLLLINDILGLSKIEAGKVELISSEISLKNTLEIITENIRPLADEKGLDLRLSVKDDLPLIETDEGKLNQVLQNVLGNSIKFTHKGGIDVSAVSDGSNISVCISDTGIGIPEEELPYIFDEFRQLDGTTSRQYGGTGLGLAIAKKTIMALGVSIHAESEPGKGSVFTIIIPVTLPEPSETDSVADFQAVLPGANLNKSSAQDKKQKPRILLVEDNEATVLQVKAVLEKEGYLVDMAPGGQAAIDFISHTIPDGIILDLMMPGIDGFRVLESIRNFQRTEHVPVLVLTAKDLTKKDLENLRNNNIQQLVQKGNIDLPGLLYKIQLMLGQDTPSKKQHAPRPQKVKRKKVSGKPGLPDILLMEDNQDNVTTIYAIVKDKYNLHEASDGEKGLIMAQSQIPDLILLDMALPGIDGKEVVKRLKENDITKHIPVMAVTAHAMKEDREIAINAGCDDYMSKPVDPEELLRRIEDLMKKNI